MWIMTVTAILCPLGSITINAEELNLQDFPYKYYYEISSTDGYSNNYKYIVAISTKRLTDVYATGNYQYGATDLNTRLKYTNVKSSLPYLGISISSNSYIYILTYSINGWEIHLPWSMYGNGNYLIAWDIKSENYSTTIPNGMPEITISNIDNVLQNILNETTQTTTTAINLQNNLAQNYNSYKTGDITPEALQISVDNTVNQLNNLNNNSGNTLADLIAVNNGLTYAQTVQDKINADEIIETQTVSTTVQTNINGYITQANNAYNQFISGEKTQSEAIELIQQQIINLNNMIGNQAKTAADVAAVNAAINTIQNTSNSVKNYSELDKTISDKSQTSDKEELNYITDLQEETSQSLEQLAPSNSLDKTQMEKVNQNVFMLIWDNTLIKMILPLAGVFMLISILLGIKYKL